MAGKGSVSILISQMKQGDEAAQQKLWERYFHATTRRALEIFKQQPRRESDEEDAVVTAFSSIFRRAQEGRFPELNDRRNLWSLLVVITERKALNQIARQQADRRGGGKLRGESVFIAGNDSQNAAGIDALADVAPAPDFVLALKENAESLLEMLPDDLTRRVALLRLEGYSNQEIAQQINRIERTVERKLHLIREIWVDEVDERERDHF